MRLTRWFLFVFLCSSLYGQELKAPPKEKIPDLIKELTDSDLEKRVQAAIQLGLAGKDAKEAQKPLEKILAEEKQPAFQAAAGFALLKFDPKHKEAGEFLRDCLRSKDDDVREMGIKVIGAFPELAIFTFLEVPDQVKVPDGLSLVVSQLARKDLKVILPLLKAKNETIRETALDVIHDAKSEDPSLIAPLMDAAKADRFMAFHRSIVLANMGKGAVEPLRKSLTDTNPIIRRLAINALTRMIHRKELEPTKDLLQDFVARLRDSDIKVGQEAAEGLRDFGILAKEAVPEFILLLQAKEVQLKRNAVKGLAAIGPEAKSAEDSLIQLAQKDKEVRLDAVDALSKIVPDNKQIIPLAIELLKQDPDSRQVMLHMFIRMEFKAKDASKAIEPYLKSKLGEERVWSAQALIAIGAESKAAIQTLRECLRSEDFRSRLPAVNTCIQLGTKAKDLLPDLIFVYQQEDEEDAKMNAAYAIKKIDPETAKKLGIGVKFKIKE